METDIKITPPEETPPIPQPATPPPENRVPSSWLNQEIEKTREYRELGSPEYIKGKLAELKAMTETNAQKSLTASGYNAEEIDSVMTTMYPGIKNIKETNQLVENTAKELQRLKMQNLATQLWNHADSIGVKVPQEDKADFELQLINKMSPEQKARTLAGDINPLVETMDFIYGIKPKPETIFERYKPTTPTPSPMNPSPPPPPTRLTNTAPAPPQPPEPPKNLAEAHQRILNLVKTQV